MLKIQSEIIENVKEKFPCGKFICEIKKYEKFLKNLKSILEKFFRIAKIYPIQEDILITNLTRFIIKFIEINYFSIKKKNSLICDKYDLQQDLIDSINSLTELNSQQKIIYQINQAVTFFKAENAALRKQMHSLIELEKEIAVTMSG